MSPRHYTIKRFLQEYIILTSLGYAFSRSLPNANKRPTPQFEHHFQSNLAVHPFYYVQPNSQAYWPHEPVGTFFDKKRGILRSFPGGGVPVLVDHHKRCSSNFVGIKPHPNQRQYYYVCKPDCVIFGKCQNLQSFDATKAQCIPYPTPDYTPVCVKPGRFPISTDCSIYYRCDADLKAHIHSCPRNTIFSPHNEKCICGAHCNPTKVSLHSSYIPQDCEHKFPPCLQNGTFRTPTDCSLYYTCVRQEGSLYLQTRFKCPELEFFDPTKGTCQPQHEVPCDSIQLSELVFPRPPPLPHLPVIYSAHYSMDSLDDSDYPTEYSLSCSKEDTISASVSSNERMISDSPVQATTSSKFPASLTTSPSKQMVDKSSENSIKIITHTPSPFPAFAFGVTSTKPVSQTNSSPTRNSNTIILPSTSPPLTVGDTSQTSTKTFAPKAIPTKNSVVVGAFTSTSLNPAIVGSSPGIISDQSNSLIDFVPFVPTKLQTRSSTSAFSSTDSSILHSSRTKHSTPLSTTISTLPRDFSITNTRLKSTAEITTTPLVPSSITPSSSTSFSSSTAEDRSLPTKSHTSTSLINTLHMSSPAVHSSSFEIITNGTVPISASQPHTSLPITTLFSPDSTTTEVPTTHSRSIQTSMPADPPILPPVTSSLKEEITAMSPNMAPTTNFSVATSSLLGDSSPLNTTESIEVTKIKPTVSTSTSVTEFPIQATDIPKLEVVVFGNLDLTVLYCPKDCSKQHEHKYDKKVFGDQHVVGIQWDPAKSKKTLSIQTV
ncbi:PREDICTED: mucin-17-like [Bactrocera latifrons]|uniref:mucin-17-like n=1 Tax=Bactrocera latifrons TaxID=174628 RepID=UPI0008DE8AA8|nr:PREDICTED: mucin-17-like [Bactrocera latifrons]